MGCRARGRSAVSLMQGRRTRQCTRTVPHLPRPASSGTIHRSLIFVLLHGRKLMNAQKHRVFVTGGTGYVGRPLITQLLERGHEVHALVRTGLGAEASSGMPGDFRRRSGWQVLRLQRSLPLILSYNWLESRIPARRRRRSFATLTWLRAAARSRPQKTQVCSILFTSAWPTPRRYEGLHRSQVAVRSHDPPKWNERHNSASLVRPGSGTPMAVLLDSDLQVDGIVAVHARRRHAPGTGHAGQMVRALVEAVETPAHGVRIVEVPQIRAAFSVILSGGRRFARETSAAVEGPL